MYWIDKYGDVWFFNFQALFVGT